MEISKRNYLAHLNKSQKEAIIDLDGPCLIVAGAGSGKTKVLTTRVVHIIKEKKAWPNQILCVTFTNKAAREMQNRIASFLKEKQTSIISSVIRLISLRILEKLSIILLIFFEIVENLNILKSPYFIYFTFFK